MIKKIIYTFLIFSVVISCKRKNAAGSVEEHFKSDVGNQLLITSEGDSLEIGFWRYDSHIEKSGFYEYGYKVGEWIYKSTDDSTSVQWEIFKKESVKFNYPNNLRVIDSLDYPMVFQGDIPDGNNFTYVVLLEYDLRKLDTSIYDYLYKVNQSREKGSTEVLKSKDVEKFYFKNTDVFKYQVVVERDDKSYNAVSYIFEVDGKLFDLTLRDTIDKMTSLEQEIFRDMLYSMECYGKDLFSYNSKQYYKKENVEFE